MGEFTVTKWACDRCGIVENMRPKLPTVAGRAALVGNVEFEWNTESIKWVELCASCNTLVKNLLTEVMEASKR